MNVRGCARCGANHEGLTLKEFAIPIEDDDGTTWTHWAACPTSGDPILFRKFSVAAP